MAYITIREYGEDSFIEKKSEFIGYAKRVENEEEAKAFVAEIKSKHKQARHNCWAYVIGENMGIQRYSDDGEPQGTAGIPILEVMKKSDITDCAVVVTRYFGGILLGAGGLTRAYTKGASIALKAGGVVEKVQGVKVSLHLDYDMIGKVQYFCGQNNWHIEDTEYTDKVIVHILAEVSVADEIEKEAIEPIQTLKTNYLGSKNPRLHTDEILIALSSTAAHNENAKKAMGELTKLKGCDAHSTVLLSSVDETTFKKLGMQLTCEPKYEEDGRKYHKH